jgi:CDP-diacylglycerol--inositol 3-phosphatidyltransferase
VSDPPLQPHAGAYTRSVDDNVFLFPSNLIGYLRVILAAASLCIMPLYPRVCTVLYFTSCILDAVDGQVARRLGQTSKFGAVLDMVTDRCAFPSPAERR